MFMRLSLLAFTIVVSACDRTAPADVSAGEFLANVQPYCGQSYQGTITSDDPQDEDWRGKTVIADFETCTDTGLRIPLHVGDDHSRTWLIALNDDGRLALRHQHNHEDGSPDAITMYGGKSSGASTATRQVFPTDRKTIELFEAEGIPESKANIWSMEIDPEDNVFVYDLQRPERHFRVEFDLSSPVESPGEAW